MHSSVLVLTSTPGFGGLIQQTLEDSGRYQVTLVESVQEALEAAGSASFDLGILDMEENKPAGEPVEGLTAGEFPAGGQPAVPGAGAGAPRPEIGLRNLCRFLRKQLPGIRLVVVPPGNENENPLVAELHPDGFLTKPFYLPDLLDTVDEVLRARDRAQALKPAVELLQAEPAHPDPRTRETPAWLADVNRAAQYLARLSMESAAQAALIVSAGELWAYAGELPQPAALELSRIVTHHWSRGGSSDVARFIRLESTGSEYMLYATSLGGKMVLALVFDIETPFSKIRSQANYLARALASPPNGEMNGGKPASEAEPSPGLPAKTDPSLESFQGLFDDVPPPLASGWTGRSKTSFVPLDVDGETDEAEAPAAQGQEPGATNPLVERRVWEPEKGQDQGQSIPQRQDEVASSPPDYLAETRPIQIGQSSAESLSDGPEVMPDELSVSGLLEPVSAAVCNLNYACMLIPRLPNHHLTGDLGTYLSDWVAQLCLAFGWRLGHLGVRPEYLLWIVNVSPTVSPSYLVRMIRHHTSQRIFSRFPDLIQENPSGDFWAPGYLVMSSSQPPPVDVMLDFIQGTRRRQGSIKSHLSSH